LAIKIAKHLTLNALCQNRKESTDKRVVLFSIVDGKRGAGKWEIGSEMKRLKTHFPELVI
jgi:hypothetical protein